MATASTPPKARLRLTPGQRGALFPMLAEAWLVHATAEGIRANDSTAKEEWRRKYLGNSLGIWSLKQIPVGGPIFRRVMGKLQEMARNGIDWILKAGDATPAELLWHARAVLAEHDIPESYASGIARNACRLDRIPLLEELEPEQLATVIRIAYGQGDRIARAAAKGRATKPADQEEVPL